VQPVWQRRSQQASSEPPVFMPDQIWQIVSGRGFTTKEDIENLIQPKLKNLSHPFALHDMNLAVDRLIKAFQNNEKIVLYGDYDLDGTPGLALLHDGLTRLGFRNLIMFQPSRLQDGYGLHAHKMADFKEAGATLLVTVDLGITDVAAVEAAAALGIDVVITDHHLPSEILPKALAIVNPNKGFCESRLQHLCGTGVAFYLVLALRMQMTEKKLLETDFNPKELLDLFALATVTDMVPLVGENRVLVKHGLYLLSQTQRPGLKRLLQELGFYGQKISSQDIAFRIAPKLNALTRLEEGVRALDVLLATTENADKMIAEALLVNQRRVQFQDKAKKIAKDLVKQFDHSKFVFIHSGDFHPGVISLVASDLMKEYNMPAFVGAVHADGKIIGSARAPDKSFHLQEMLKAASEALVKFGGHQLAAGFELTTQSADKLRELMTTYFVEKKSADANIELAPVLYDAEVSLSDLNDEFMTWLENLGPYGMQFDPPKLLIRGMKVKSCRKIKGSFLKYVLEKSGKVIEAPWFSGAIEIPEGNQVDVLFEPQYNSFAGRKSIQAFVQDMKPH
jgi:single-stranded-DNA-specific exonuclease